MLFHLSQRETSIWLDNYYSPIQTLGAVNWNTHTCIFCRSIDQSLSRVCQKCVYWIHLVLLFHCHILRCLFLSVLELNLLFEPRDIPFQQEDRSSGWICRFGLVQNLMPLLSFELPRCCTLCLHTLVCSIRQGSISLCYMLHEKIRRSSNQTSWCMVLKCFQGLNLCLK